MPLLTDEQRRTLRIHENDLRRYARVFEGRTLGDEAAKNAEALTALLARVDELEVEYAELLVDAFLEIASEKDGWYCSDARTTAMHYGNELVELGLWEKDATRGHGRRQWYRPKESK